jgi:hypothetical protein
LVVPAVEFDPGTSRALPAPPAHIHSTGTHVLDSQNREIAVPTVGQSYTLVADVSNNGSGGAYGGIAEFYVQSAETFDQAASSGVRMRVFGYGSFVALPRSTISVRCPTPWIPATPSDLTSSVLVQVYDLTLDPLRQPFNPRSDRHVGRLDLTDFAGIWEGFLVGVNVDDSRQVRFTITQSGLNVSVTPPGLTTGLAESVAEGRVRVRRVTSDNGHPEEDVWTLTLARPDTLHVRDDYVTQGADYILEGDLHRVSP